MNIEVQDPSFTAILSHEFARRRAISRPLTLVEVDTRSLPVRLRDGTARLFGPYL
jgi:cardiolipin synthase